MLLAQQTDSSGNDSIPKDLKILNFFGGEGKQKSVKLPALGRGNIGKKQELFVVLVTSPFCRLSSFIQKAEFLLGGIKTFFFFKFVKVLFY